MLKSTLYPLLFFLNIYFERQKIGKDTYSIASALYSGIAGDQSRLISPLIPYYRSKVPSIERARGS